MTRRRRIGPAKPKHTPGGQPGNDAPSNDAPSSDARTIALIDSVARDVRNRIDDGELPSIDLPVRSLSNVTYEPTLGHFELGSETKQRTLSVHGVKGFAQTLRMMALCRNMVQADDFATKREAYYVSKNWGECRFDEQSESDAIMDDIEALASRDGISREQLRFYPESHGGSVSGALTVIDRDPETGQDIEIDCRRLGRGAFTIPRSVDTLRLETDARFALVIETGGMFQRLNNHRRSHVACGKGQDRDHRHEIAR